MPVETPDGLLPQVEPQVHCGDILTGPHRAHEVTKPILIGIVGGVKELSHGLHMAGVRVFLAHGVLRVDVDDPGRSGPFRFRKESGHLTGPTAARASLASQRLMDRKSAQLDGSGASANCRWSAAGVFGPSRTRSASARRVRGSS